MRFVFSKCLEGADPGTPNISLKLSQQLQEFSKPGFERVVWYQYSNTLELTMESQWKVSVVELGGIYYSYTLELTQWKVSVVELGGIYYSYTLGQRQKEVAELGISILLKGKKKIRESQGGRVTWY